MVRVRGFHLLLAATLCCLRPAAALAATPANPAATDEAQALFDLYFSDDTTVESATRSPKPLNRVAENVTVIDRDEIEAMNAHSVADILSQVAGVFVSFNGREMDNGSSIVIHGSDYEHVLVYVDGVRWNDAANDFNDTAAIPVRIIDRIEVIKGAASSTWGAAFGGVVNIITKRPGTSARPVGSVHTSLGEDGTRSADGEAAGALGSKVGYYLYAGSQHSDGLVNERFNDRDSLYGKVRFDLPGATTLTITHGRSTPRYRGLGEPTWDWVQSQDATINTFSWDGNFSSGAAFHLGYQDLDNSTSATFHSRPDDAPFWDMRTDTVDHGLDGRLSLAFDNQTVVLGGEHHRQSFRDSETTLPYDAATVYDAFWGVYANDTLRLGRWAVIPGLRYDHLSRGDNQLSPSLGVTWNWRPDTMFRALVSRGYRKPPASLTAGDPLLRGAQNPDLEPENVTTYQLGMETTALRYCHLKITTFMDKAGDVWTDATGPWTNSGNSERYAGFEIETETIPFHSLRLRANYTYVHGDYYDVRPSDSQEGGTLALIYDDLSTLDARLAGSWVWWNQMNGYPSGLYNAMTWEASVNYHLIRRPAFGIDLFAAAHNLFDGSQYWVALYPNAGRWLEAGVKLRF